MKPQFKNIIRVLIPTERRRFYFFILVDVFISILDILALLFLLFTINFYTHPQTALPSFIPQHFFNHDSILPVACFVIFFCIKNFTGYIFSRAQYQFVYGVSSRLSQKNMLQYLEGSYTNYVNIDSAVQIKRISQQPIEFGYYVLWGLQQILSQSLLIIITIAALLLFNAKLFLLLIIILFPAIAIVAYIIKKKSSTAKLSIKKSSELSLQYLKETIGGFVESNINGRNNFFTERYIHKQQRLNQYMAGLQAVQGMPNRIMEVFAVFGFFILIVLSKWTDNAVTPSVFTIGAFMATAYKIIPGMVKILNCSGFIKTYEYTIDNQSQTSIPATTNTVAEKITGISYKNISFNYKDKNIVNDFNCCLKPGDFAGITGVSGKGKTTLVNLLLGFEDAGKGTIHFNEKPATANERQQYWKNIAYVKQQPFVMHDTIESNITLGDNNIDNEKLNHVITVAGMDKMLTQFPEGIKTIITENGKNISGGQRQRIAIARALYKNADVIILDEPFNELDNEAENKLLQYFKQQAQLGKIVILITHNKESLLSCNKIISLDGN